LAILSSLSKIIHSKVQERAHETFRMGAGLLKSRFAWREFLNNCTDEIIASFTPLYFGVNVFKNRMCVTDGHVG
jgi:hypothetical protein